MLQRTLSFVITLALSSLLLAGVDKKADPTPEQIQNIINKFVQNETDFAKAREQYTYCLLYTSRCV